MKILIKNLNNMSKFKQNQIKQNNKINKYKINKYNKNKNKIQIKLMMMNYLIK